MAWVCVSETFYKAKLDYAHVPNKRLSCKWPPLTLPRHEKDVRAKVTLTDSPVVTKPFGPRRVMGIRLGSVPVVEGRVTLPLTDGAPDQPWGEGGDGEQKSNSPTQRINDVSHIQMTVLILRVLFNSSRDLKTKQKTTLKLLPREHKTFEKQVM